MEHTNTGSGSRIFGGLKMSWLRVILSAVFIGIYTGAVMLIKPLEDTSFQDIGVLYECWVLFAIIIVVNCDRPFEAMLKGFVFFLISQPVIYAVEIIFGSLTLELAVMYYFKGLWFKATLLTLPGSFIAYFCKKQNVFGAFILGMGNTIIALMGTHHIVSLVDSFPHHLLSAVFCIAIPVVLALNIQHSKRDQLISAIMPFMLAAAIVAYASAQGLSI